MDYEGLEMTIFWVNPGTGTIIKATSDDGQSPSPNAVAITTLMPESGKQKWDFTLQVWGPVPPRPPNPALVALDAAIQGAGTLTALKVVLKGMVGLR